MKAQGGTVHRLKDQGGVPYLVLGDQWVGFEDKQSLKKKVSCISLSGNKSRWILYWISVLRN